MSIDHVAQGLSRVVQQYRDKPKFTAFLQAILQVNNEVEKVLQSLLMLPDIDTMSGANLDVIGAIVGVSRVVPNVVMLHFFGFDGWYYMTVFGEEGQPDVGSRFYEEGEPFSGTSVLNDPEYRMLIRSKIAKNSSSGTCEDILWSMWYLLHGDEYLSINVVDNEDMTIALEVSRALTATEKAIITTLDVLPRPAGVGVTHVTTPTETIPIPASAGGAS